MRLRLGRPARRAVQLPVELTAEHAREPARRSHERIEVDPRRRRHRARAARRGPPSPRSRWPAARTGSRRATDRRVENGRAPLERGPRTRVTRVARVVPVEPTGWPRIETRSTSRRTRRGVATPIVSARTSSPARGEPLAEVGDGRRVDLALERAAERTRTVTVTGSEAPVEDRHHARDRLLERRVAVAPVEGLGRGQRAVQTGRGRSAANRS